MKKLFVIFILCLCAALTFAGCQGNYDESEEAQSVVSSDESDMDGGTGSGDVSSDGSDLDGGTDSDDGSDMDGGTGSGDVSDDASDMDGGTGSGDVSDESADEDDESDTPAESKDETADTSKDGIIGGGDGIVLPDDNWD